MSEIKNESIKNNFKFQELEIGENKYLVGVCKKDDLRQVYVTNFNEFYEENLTIKDIIKRCEDLNPLNDFDCKDIVDNLLDNIPKYVVASSTVDNIRLENKIEGGRFEFYISPKKSSSDNLNNNLMESLYFSFSELHCRYHCLLDIIKKKDQEIAEYKAEGVQLSRKSLMTEPFDESIFKTELKNTKPLDKIKVFLDAINFHNLVKDSHDDDNSIKPELKKSESSTQDSFQNKSTRKQKCMKRPSSDIRCAVAPNSNSNKTKVHKQDTTFKFL